MNSVLAKPVNERNAIEAAGFSVTFDRNFNSVELDRLLGLEAELKAELPIFTKIQKVEFTIDQSGMSRRPADFSGVQLQQLKSHGGLNQVSWVMKVDEQSIHITCGHYTRWHDVSRKVFQFLTTAIGFLDADSLRVVGVASQVRDKFVYANEPSDYELSDVFNLNSDFLTRKTASAGALWHLHQGWFDVCASLSNARALNVLNIASARFGNQLTAMIDHSVQSNLIESIAAREAFVAEADSSVIYRTYCEFHELNKSILAQLLAPQQLRAIGMVGPHA